MCGGGCRGLSKGLRSRSSGLKGLKRREAVGTRAELKGPLGKRHKLNAQRANVGVFCLRIALSAF